VLSTSSPGGVDVRHLVGLQFIDPPAASVARLGEALEADEEDDAD